MGMAYAWVSMSLPQWDFCASFQSGCINMSWASSCLQQKLKWKPTRWSPRTRMLTRMLMAQMSKHMDMQWRTTLFCNSLFEQSCSYFPCYQSAVWSGKCRVWSVKCGVWSVACGVSSVECGVRSVKCKVWSVKCKVRSVECGVRSVEFVNCRVWSVECKV